MRMALPSCSSLAAADFFLDMAFYRHPCDDGGVASSAFYGGAGGHSPAAAFPRPAFGAAAPAGLQTPPQQQRQHDAFECLSDDGISSVVPGTFGTPPTPTPPPRMPWTTAEQVVVPDASGYAHARGVAAVVGEGTTARTTDSRIAFRVRSEEEVLDDGYKWRKYGKKSVKNSPNPRNYYRCSTEGCSVKKRVERDKDDPSYVVTMYEGVHNHVSPGTVYYATQDAASGRFFVAGMHQFGP